MTRRCCGPQTIRGFDDDDEKARSGQIMGYERVTIQVRFEEPEADGLAPVTVLVGSTPANTHASVEKGFVWTTGLGLDDNSEGRYRAG